MLKIWTALIADAWCMVESIYGPPPPPKKKRKNVAQTLKDNESWMCPMSWKNPRIKFVVIGHFIVNDLFITCLIFWKVLLIISPRPQLNIQEPHS